MKHIIKIILALFIGFQVNQAVAQSDELVNVCALGIGNATYLKDYKVKLSASSVSPPSAKFNVIMNKGTMYKITVCNAEGYAGEAVVQLMENATLLGTNLKPDGTFVTAIGFQCQKTGMYSINLSFKDGKEGAAVAILSYVNM
ncbi:MAG: hypothetical protein CVU09_08760 [Bacteroidetes bacterium HGW-Bacteroidetes-4]|jgi:hypothetical protein|nr:MAG: hypothetical protein CVU09_08760 [Bacteroidetes bacterium HGW-Bacteroidetes-4]